MKILHISSVNPEGSISAFLKNHQAFLEASIPKNDITYFNAYTDSPNRIWDKEYDAIILDPTFLAYRWAAPHDFRHIRKCFSFIKNAGGLKIALPQDDYDCHLTLDDWLVDWKIDIVYTVCPRHWEILYPRFSQVGQIKLGFTGYIADDLLARKPKPFSERLIEIGYRAKQLPPWFGRIGQNKSEIGPIVRDVAKTLGISTDIVVGDEGTIFGTAWYDFLENCKFTLGANSGSSLLDPYGEIQRNIKSYMASHNGKIDFETAERLFFPGLDGVRSFTALSPRNIEAALCNSCQILVKGEYSDVLKPWIDYLPLEPDASNLPDLLPIMRDEPRITAMIQHCRETILNAKNLYYSSKAEKILEDIELHKKIFEKKRAMVIRGFKKRGDILSARIWLIGKKLKRRIVSSAPATLLHRLMLRFK